MLEEKTIRILLVEDDEMDAKLMQTSLKREGVFDIKVVPTLQEAKDLIRDDDFDLVLSDLNIPDSNGLETLKGLVAVRQEVPIIVLTGMEDDRLGDEALKKGAQDYIVKGSVDGKVLARIIRYSIERYSLQAGLVQAQKMEVVGRLAGGMAHDLNNLLTVIMGFGELVMMEKGKVPETIQQNLKNIQEASEKASQLTKQLLVFSRRHDVQSKKTDVNELIKNTEKMVQTSVGEDVSYQLNLEEGCWSALIDPIQIESVFMNLIFNARDAMEGKGEIEVRTSNVSFDQDQILSHATAQSGDYVEISVRDTGLGMNEEVKSHLFEPFFTTKEKGKGTGLGLATAYDLIEKSGGYIHLESEENKGTTFRIYLPRVQDD